MVVDSGSIITRLKSVQFEVCHGYTVKNPAKQYEAYAALARKDRVRAVTAQA